MYYIEENDFKHKTSHSLMKKKKKFQNNDFYNLCAFVESQLFLGVREYFGHVNFDS